MCSLHALIQAVSIQKRLAYIHSLQTQQLNPISHTQKTQRKAPVATCIHRVIGRLKDRCSPNMKVVVSVKARKYHPLSRYKSTINSL